MSTANAEADTSSLGAKCDVRDCRPGRASCLRRCVLLLSAAVGAVHAAQPAREAASPGRIGSSPTTTSPTMTKTPNELRRWLTVGERRFAITLADTEAARAFDAMLPLTLDMEELNGNEKKKDLASALPTHASRPGTIRSGDILLWGARTVVVFYRTFESPYGYTRLGRVDDPTGLAQALGQGDVRVVFSGK